MLFAALITLALTPWSGPSLPTVSANAVKYKLVVRGEPKQNVHLDASGLPSGWVASFCTATICSPFSYTMPLDKHGRGTIEFQAIRVDDAAPKHTHAVVSAQGGPQTSVDVTAPH